MYHLGSIRCEHGAALVISLLLLVVLFVISSGTLTTSRIGHCSKDSGSRASPARLV